MVTMMLSRIPPDLMLYLSTNCNIVEVYLMFYNPIQFIASLVMALIVAPKSIRIFYKLFFPICTIRTGTLGSRYFGKTKVPNIILKSYPNTWIVIGSFHFLPSLLIHKSLMVLALIGISFNVWSSGIRTLIIWSLENKSNSNWDVSFNWMMV